MELKLRDLNKERLSVRELDRLTRGRDYLEFLNPRNELYRKRNMKEHPPSRAEALALMAREPNLIRRPLVIWGRQILLGYDERKLETLGS